ncbi:MAG: hypothetical protein K8I29_17505 [Alphaproteobacteria bacterium]|uniref:Uncharacterized protein n=1 Tax=Candidatus Nitrobium versatile TaxID=2884831 RepID=A0A953M2Z1_9BACT|nr:hypothetical protein [Candidatus Nitrobium versatile]
MVIDARETESRELFLRLRELFAQSCNEEISLEILLPSRQEAKKTKSFAEMSGYRTVTEEREGCYRVLIAGVSCRCGR